MAGTWVGSGAQAESSNAALSSVAYPTSGEVTGGTVNADDIAILHFSTSGSSSANPAPPGGQGWTLIGSNGLTNGTEEQWVWWRRCSGGEEGDTISISQTTGLSVVKAARIHILRGITTSDPPYEDSPVENSGTTTSVSVGPVTGLDSTDRLIIICLHDADDDENPLPDLTSADVTWSKRTGTYSPTGGDYSQEFWTGVPSDTAPQAAARTNSLADTWLALTVAFIPGTSAQTLTLSRVDHTRVFNTHVVAGGAVGITPNRVDHTREFYTLKISLKLHLSRVDHTRDFPNHTLTPGAVALTLARVDHTRDFPTHTVSSGAGAQTVTLDRVDHTRDFPTHTLTRGAVTITPARVDHTRDFPTHSLVSESLLLLARVDHTRVFNTHTLTRGAVTIPLGRTDHTRVFPTHTVDNGAPAPPSAKELSYGFRAQDTDRRRLNH